MYGAIIGDIVGSRFEFSRRFPEKEFDLFTKESRWTDDTVMTVAIAEALMEVSLFFGYLVEKNLNHIEALVMDQQ